MVMLFLQVMCYFQFKESWCSIFLLLLLLQIIYIVFVSVFCDRLVFVGKLQRFDKDSYYSNSTVFDLNDIGSILELYKASQIKLFQDEEVLGNLNLRSFNFLKQMISLPPVDGNEEKTFLRQEVVFLFL